MDYQTKKKFETLVTLVNKRYFLGQCYKLCYRLQNTNKTRHVTITWNKYILLILFFKWWYVNVKILSFFLKLRIKQNILLNVSCNMSNFNFMVWMISQFFRLPWKISLAKICLFVIMILKNVTWGLFFYGLKLYCYYQRN